MRLFKTRIGFILFLIIICLSLTECGIEPPITAFDAPIYVSAVTDTYIFKSTINHTGDEFLGFEVYYKISESGSAVTVNLTNPDTLAAYGFKRAYLASDIGNDSYDIIPLIQIPGVAKGSIYEVIIDFTLDRVAETGPEITSAPVVFPPITMRRAAVYNSGEHINEYKMFTDFQAGDTDVSVDVLNDILSNMPVQVELYCFAYGRSLDPQSFMHVIRSPLTYLLSLDINFGTY